MKIKIVITLLLAMLLSAPTAAQEWKVNLTVVFPDLNDTVTFGVKQNATEGFDLNIDVSEPPAPPTGEQAYFYYPENEKDWQQKLSESYVSQNYVIEFPLVVIYPGLSTNITIEWNATDLGDVPSFYSIKLIGEQGIINMREKANYTFTTEVGKDYEFTIRVADIAKPTVEITSPSKGATVKGTISIAGTANDPYLASYVVEYSSDGIEWTRIAESNESVTDNVLATWDTTTVPDGNYKIRLTATDLAGNTNSASVNVNVDNVAPSPPPRRGGGGGGGIPLPPPLAAPSEFYTSLIKYLKANEPRVIAMTSDIINKVGILEIQAVIQQTMSVSTTVSRVSALPSGVTEPEGNVYSFFEIVFTQYGTQKKVEPSGYLKYRVSKEWLGSINAEPSDIKFLKWDNGWIELSSEVLDEDDDYYYFKVNLDSFSLFAVVAVKKVTPTPQIPEETETPVEEKTKEITKPTPITTTPTPTPAWWQQPTGIAAIVIIIVAIIVLAYALRRK